jgi:hypothetical protein
MVARVRESTIPVHRGIRGAPVVLGQHAQADRARGEPRGSPQRIGDIIAGKRGITLVSAPGGEGIVSTAADVRITLDLPDDESLALARELIPHAGVNPRNTE